MSNTRILIIAFVAGVATTALIDHLLGDIVARTQTTVEQAQEEQP